MTNFKHINAAEQLVNGTITSPLLAPGAVTVLALNINTDLSFNEYQALQFRIENVSSTPAAGHVGRVVFNTTTQQLLIDNGSAFVPVSASGSVSGVYSESNPIITGNVQFLAGTNVTLSQTGQAITINSTGGGANTTLSNLTSPTALNQDVLPASDGSRSLGSSSLQFEQLYTYNVISNNDDLDLTSTYNVYLASGSGFDIVLNSGSGNINADTHNIINIGTVNSVSVVTTNFQLTANPTNGYVLTSDASGNATWQPSTGVASYQQDLFNISVPTNVFILTHTPVTNSQLVFWNGLSLANGVSEDYTLSGTTVTLNAGITVKVGDKILVTYAY